MDVGTTLRQAREHKGLTLDYLSSVTRVTLPILTAIERNDPRGIPPRPYGRGFVRSYASEVGLDPEQIVRDFFSQFAPHPDPAAEPPAPSNTTPIPRVPTWIPRVAGQRWAVFALVVVGLVTAFAVMIQRSRPEPAGVGVTHPVATSGQSAASTASTLGRVERPAAAEGITIALEATSPAWVRADVDGHRVIYRTLQAGERQLLRGKQVIRIRTGNAGALRWQIGQRPATAMGHPGEVLSTTVTSADARRR